MHGHVTLTKYDIGNYKNEDFIAAQKEKRLDILLKELEVNEQLEGDNQILHHLVVRLLYSGGNNFGSAPDPSIGGPGNGSEGVLWLAALNTRKNIIIYSDMINASGSGTVNDADDNIYGVGFGSGKRFIEDAMVWGITKNIYGKQEATLSSTFVWFPLEAVSNDISNLSMWYYYNVDAAADYYDGNYRYAVHAYWRFRTSTGQLTTIKKSEKEALALRYDFILTAH